MEKKKKKSPFRTAAPPLFQMVPLCAHVKLATLCLSSDHINFGLCYLGQTQAKEVKLYTFGSQTHWSLILGNNLI